MKKIILSIFCISNIAMLNAQFTQKKIAQRRDNFINNSWQGIDSIVWQYNNKKDSTQIYSLLFTSGAWTPLQNNLYQYGSNGLLSNVIRQTWSNGNWVNSSQYISTYDANNNEISNEKQVWNSGSNTWQSNIRYANTFSATNKISTNELQVFNSGNWLNNSKQIYNYDSNDSLAENISQNFDTPSFSYKNILKKVYNWTAQGIFKYQEMNYNDTTTSWEYLSSKEYFRNTNGAVNTVLNKIGKNLDLDSKTEFTYDTASTMLATTLSSYMDTSLHWQQYQKENYTYNTDSTTHSYLLSKLLFSIWTPDTSLLYTYLPNKKIDYFIQGKYNGSAMIDVHKSSFIYDANGNNTYYLLQNINGSNYSNNYQAFYYYNQYPLAITNNIKNNLQALIYPIPCANTLNITIENTLDKTVQINIFNTQGQIVQQLTQPLINNTIQLNTAALQTGNYIIQIGLGNKFLQKEFCKE